MKLPAQLVHSLRDAQQNFDWLAQLLGDTVAISKTGQSVANATFVGAAFDTVQAGEKAHADLANNRIRVARGGWWLMIARAFYGVGTGNGFLKLSAGGADYAQEELPQPGGLHGCNVNVVDLAYLKVGDAITATLWQNSGGLLNCDSRLVAARWGG